MHHSSRICNIGASKFRVGRSERTIHKYRQNDEGSAEAVHRANEANLIRAISELAAPRRLDQTLSPTEQF